MPLTAEVVREITAADLVLLGTERGIKAPTIKRLRDAHHGIARLIATDTSGSEIAAITGYSESRISILKNDPAFQELVAHYKRIAADAAEVLISDGATKLQAVRNDAIEELHDRLQDEPEKLDTAMLLDIVKITADRTGLGPATKSTNVNLNVDIASRIEAGRRRVAQFGGGVAPPTGAGAAPKLLASARGGKG